ncbi:MAG: hypothetical protein AW07_04562 [Candidatus Accumulibacter sp. SK-11]|nr:MAG: hypothetical protein AW07_04562 [Candidatus Accumulibacter sp. SK-11]
MPIHQRSTGKMRTKQTTKAAYSARTIRIVCAALSRGAGECQAKAQA